METSKWKTIDVNYRDALMRRLTRLRSGYVLDAGTGAGNMTKALSNGLNLQVVSADLNRLVFSEVLDRVDREKVSFVECDFAHLPFRDEAFRCTVCDLVLSTTENLAVDGVMSEFRRTLKTRSKLYITDYYPEDTPRNLGDKHAAETQRLYTEVSEFKTHTKYRAFAPNTLVKALRDAGFRGVKHERIVANEPLEWRKRVFKEYYRSMKREISEVNDIHRKQKFMKRLESLRIEINANGTVNWNRGVNYLVQASK